MSQPEERPGCDIQIRVCGREDEDEDTCVQDSREELDAGDLDSYDEGGGGSGATTVLVPIDELLRVVGDEHSQEKDE